MLQRFNDRLAEGGAFYWVTLTVSFGFVMSVMILGMVWARG